MAGQAAALRVSHMPPPAPVRAASHAGGAAAAAAQATWTGPGVAVIDGSNNDNHTFHTGTNHDPMVEA